MQGTMPGARRRGRPRTAWMDNIKTWTGLSVEESIRMTEDRENGESTSIVRPSLGSRTAIQNRRHDTDSTVLCLAGGVNWALVLCSRNFGPRSRDLLLVMHGLLSQQLYVVNVGSRLGNLLSVCDTIWYYMIRDAILTCAQKLT